LLVVGAAVFTPVLTGYWLADDFSWVGDFYRYPWGDTLRLFLADWSRAISQEYRPLWAISFMIDLRLWGPSPLALHVTNLGLHLAACILVWYLAATSPGAGKLAAPLAVSFFALAPLHAEPVSWISARGHILAPIFVLAALILLRRFEQRGRRVTYLAAIGCALWAFATQEVAVALPPLLLLRDVADAPRRDRQWLRRMAVLHAPFWAALVLYLGFRYLTFGMLARPGTFASVSGLLHQQYIALRNLWLSPITAVGVPGGWAGSVTKAALCLLISCVLLAPFVTAPARGRTDLARGLVFFAVLWPFVCTAVLFGAGSPRHFYLASVGVAIALGLAGSRLLMSVRGVALPFSVVIGLVLGVSAAGLISNISHHARSGRLSRVLAGQIDRALELAERDPRAVTVIIPEFPGRRTVFWDYFYPSALIPPFRRSVPPPRVLPSFAPCHCLPEEWKAEHAATLAWLKDGSVSAVHLVLWDARQSAFVTRSLSQREFWQGGYAARDGPLVRPRRPGLPAPELP
jgi:hypothetical protein